MNRLKLRTLSQWVALMMLTGCQSGGIIHYTAPEVTGRVLAADTRQPIANVRIQRAGSTDNDPLYPLKGGQQLIQPAPVLTDGDGRFVLAGKSVLTLFRSPGWWTVPVTFQHSGYEGFQTNYGLSNVTGHAPDGAPVVDAGDVLLQPVAK
jgi:hypothetical protein